ncbi:MAG: hypothetical protein IT427_06600 [Pirellulales bacterium]|nr:hypothetical protein [Pirellulales bacterium]
MAASVGKPTLASIPNSVDVQAAAVQVAGEINDPIRGDQLAAESQQTVDAWPRWFLPGAAATVAIGVVLFVLRLLLQSPEAAPIGVDGSRPNQPIVESAPQPRQLPSDATMVADTPNPDADSTHPSDAANGFNLPAAKSPTDNPQPANEAAPDKSSVAQSPAAMSTPAVAPSSSPNVPSEPASAGTADIANAEPASVVSTVLETSPGHSASTASVPPMPTLQRVPPRQISLEARLADSVRGIEVRNLPLNQFLELLSNLSAVPISFDLDALEQLGHTPTEPITLQLNYKTLAEVLDAALGPKGLGYDIGRGVIVVGRPQVETPRQVPYTVDDLAGDDASLAELANVICQLITPQSWQQNGGKSSMTAGSGKIVVDQTPAIQYKLLVFCEKLRVARGLPIKSRYDPATFLLTTRHAKANGLLKRPMKANFSTPQPLAGVVEWLRHATKAAILVDHAALTDAETSIESHCSAVSNGKSLAMLFDDLLTPMGLSWRVVNATTIEITTPEAAVEHGEIEFFPVKDLAADVAAGKALADQVRSQLGPSAANPLLGVVIYFDAPSKSLIVRAPQQMQGQVESYLNSQRAEK